MKVFNTRSEERTPWDSRGSIAFFVAAFIIPLLFFLFSLSLDLTKYYSETQKAQKALDDAALYAYRFLPYAEDAKTAAQAYLRDFGRLAQLAQVSTNNQSVSITLRSFSELSFPRLLGLDVKIPLSAYARAWGSPQDVFIALDSSNYLAPVIPGGAPWGSEADWPAASFFQSLQPVYHKGTQVDARLLTGRCFNPTFSVLKKAAITAYDYLSAGGLNAVGLGFYPGGPAYVDLGRDVVPGGDRGAGLGEARFETLQSGIYSRNEWCAAVAQEELRHLDYSLPPYSARITRNWDPESGRPLQMISAGSWSLNPEYVPYMQAREVIWGRSAQEGDPASVSALLAELRARLIGAATLATRRALRDRPLKSGLVLAGDVPWQAGRRFPDPAVTSAMQLELERIKQDLGVWKGGLKLHYVLFQHAGNQTADFDSRIAGLRSFFETASRDEHGQLIPNFQIQLVYVENPPKLSEKIIAALVLDGRSAVLAR